MQTYTNELDQIFRWFSMRPRMLNRVLFLWTILGVQLALMFGILELGAGKISPFSIVITVIITLICSIATILVFYVFHKKRRVVTFQQTVRYGWSIILSGIALLIIFWIAMPYSINSAALTLIRIYTVTTVIVAILSLLIVSKTQNLPVPAISGTVILITSLAIAILLSFLYIGRTPTPLFADEPQLVNLGWGIFTLRRMEWPMIHTTAPLLIITPFSIFYPAAGHFLNMAGVGVPQLRAFFLIIGWFSLYYIYLIGKALYGKLAGILALAIAPFLLLPFNYARPDIIVVTMTSASLYFMISGRKQNAPFKHFLAGFLVSFGIEGHPYAFRFILVIGLFYFIEYLSAIRTSRRWIWNDPFWLFCLGCLTYIPIFYFFHIFTVVGLRSPIEVLASQYTAQQYMSYPNPLIRMISENYKFYIFYFRMHPIQIALLIIGLIAALKRRQPENRLLLNLVVASHIFGAIFLTHNNLYYGVFDVPFIALLVGGFLSKLVVTYRETRVLSLLGTANICIIIALLAADIMLIGNPSPPTAQFIEAGRKIDVILPDDADIVGTQVYWLGMTRRTKYSLTDFFFEGSNKHLFHPDAMIVTLGDGEMNFPGDAEYGLALALEHGLKTAYCFYSDGGNEIRLFVHEKDLPEGAPRNCKP
jgi:hypothetical protein